MVSPRAGGGAPHPPVRDGYFADPFVARDGEGGYVAYGTHPEPASSGAVFELLVSPDLRSWTSRGPVLERADAALGDQYWAPEVAFRDGRWWMYYSVGHDIAGHHIRVAVADAPSGPFRDLGMNLTPHESFAIDPHPFCDEDGEWYLFFARDVLDTERAGTHLAVAPMPSPSELGTVHAALAPYADWQIYERHRPMYGSVYDWHTLEGPSVVLRHGRYWMTFSGGAWTGPGYAVSWASSPRPLGPWTAAPIDAPPLLSTGSRLIGPGHNSLVTAPDGRDVIAFHAWDATRTLRQFHLAVLQVGPDAPVVDLDAPL